MPGRRRSVMMMSKAKSASRSSAASPDVGLLDRDSRGRQAARRSPARSGASSSTRSRCFGRVRHLRGRQASISDTSGSDGQHRIVIPLAHSCPNPARDSIRYHLLEAEPPVERKTISIMKACELVGVSRRTIYNWLVERQDRIRPHGRRLGPHLRRHAVARSARQRPRRPRSPATWQTEGGTRLRSPCTRRASTSCSRGDRWTNPPNCAASSTG